MSAPHGEVYTFDVTLDPATQPSGPQTFPIPIPVRRVERIEVVIPIGVNGVVGFRLASAGQQIIPVNNGGWVIGSGETVGWSLPGLIESGAWQLVGYNTGVYPHTLHIRFVVSVLAGAAAPPAPAIPDLTGMSSFGADDLEALLAFANADVGE